MSKQTDFVAGRFSMCSHTRYQTKVKVNTKAASSSPHETVVTITFSSNVMYFRIKYATRKTQEDCILAVFHAIPIN